MKRYLICGACFVAAAAAAWPWALVEVDVADVGAFEAFRSELGRRCLYVGGYAYTAVAETELGTFAAGGRRWREVAAAAADEGFLVLPATASYDGAARATLEVGGGNRVFVLSRDAAAGLIPLYGFNFLGPMAPPREGRAGAGAFNPLEAGAVERVERERLMAAAERLQAFYSRYVFNDGNEAATAYLSNQYGELPRAHVSRQYFPVNGYGYAKDVANVVARIDGVKDPDQQVVVGSHFDSITYASFGNAGAAAPGADDNASATAAVLECARILSNYAFDRTLIFVAFNAEELGLLGSDYYARAAAARGDDIRAMVNADMVAYDAVDELDAAAIADAASYDLAELMASKAARYTTVQMEPSASGSPWSDQYSFWNYGYKAVWAFEGWNDDSPYIHSDDDTVETYNPQFFTEMTKVLVATVFELAGPNTSPLIGITEPDGDDYADGSFTLRWWDVDADDGGRDATISLFWAEEPTAAGGTLIADGIGQNEEGNRGSFRWDTAALPAGRYYIYAVIDDGVNAPYTATSAGPVVVVHQPRVVAYPNPARARAGQATITFDGLFPGDKVTVYDLAGTRVFQALAGGRRLQWDVSAVASGVYVYRVASAVMAGPIAGKLAVLK